MILIAGQIRTFTLGPDTALFGAVRVSNSSAA